MKWAAVIVCAVLLLAACGGGGNPTTDQIKAAYTGFFTTKTSLADHVALMENGTKFKPVIQSFLSNPALGPTVRKRARLLYQGGVRIYTTLDPSLQRTAERVLEARMSGPGMPQSALVSIRPDTGAIVTMAVGNAPFGPGARYDLAVDPGGGRTAGSAFKGFTLATALKEGISPNKVYNGNSPKTIPHCGGGQTWTLHNAEPGGGDFPLWLATAESVNTVFAAERAFRTEDCAALFWARVRAPRKVGRAMAMRMPMISTTTMSSMRVKPSSSCRFSM